MRKFEPSENAKPHQALPSPEKPMPRRQWLSAAPLAFFGVVAAAVVEACGNKIPQTNGPFNGKPGNGAQDPWSELPEDTAENPLAKNKIAKPVPTVSGGAVSDIAFNFLTMSDILFDFTGYTADPTLITKSALYGNNLASNQKNTHVLLALKIGQATEGDLLSIFRYEATSSGSLCAMRRIQAGDVNAAILFEGLYLSGTDKLEIMLTKKNNLRKKTRHPSLQARKFCKHIRLTG